MTISPSSAPSGHAAKWPRITSRSVLDPTALDLPTLANEVEVAYRWLYGGDLLTWQVFAADTMCRVRPDGQWLHDEYGLVVGRQNGKTRLFTARILAGLVMFGDRIAHGAQDRELPRGTFLQIVEVLEGSPLLSRMVKRVDRGSGKEQITMRTGGWYRVLSSRARSAPWVRGNVLLVIDEFLEEPDATRLQALLSTQLAAKRRQIIYASTAGHAWSLPLHELRQRALDTEAPAGLAFLEYSADPGTDPDDPDEWARANPALGESLTLEALQALRVKSSESAWRQENLSQHVHLVSEHAFDLDAWEASVVAELIPPTDRDLALAVVVDPSRTVAAVVASWPLAGRTAIELVAYVVGEPLVSDGRLAQAVLDFCHDHPTRHPVAFDPWTTRNVADLLEAAAVRTEPVTGLDWVNACGHMTAEVSAGRIAHLGRDTLTRHVHATGRHEGADGRWWFHRGSEPIVAVTAATRALWVATRPRVKLAVY